MYRRPLYSQNCGMCPLTAGEQVPKKRSVIQTDRFFHAVSCEPFSAVLPVQTASERPVSVFVHIKFYIYYPSFFLYNNTKVTGYPPARLFSLHEYTVFLQAAPG